MPRERNRTERKAQRRGWIGITVLLLAFAAVAQAAIPAAERQALIDLYTNTNGAGWTNRSNWRNATDTDFNDPGTECSWHGATCDNGGTTVLLLSLRLNNLAGPLPPSLANLTNLIMLDFALNRLSGSLPPQLGNLQYLALLVLHSNQLTGTIPPELGNLPSLDIVRLDDNSFSGEIPPELGNLAVLTNLELQKNQLSGPIPPELGSIANLQTLGLYENQLTGPIPPQLGGLTELNLLWLANNQLSGPVPPELGNLGSLRTLDLQTNQLSGPIPIELGNLAVLEHLDLTHNFLTGSIPPTLGSLTTLQTLRLGYNRLGRRIPPELGGLGNLNLLHLQGNTLEGSIPTSLMNLTSLLTGQLRLEYNALHTDDAALRAFLDARQSDWASTQTIAPAGLSTGSPTFNTITVSWTPIAYTGETGGYRVWARPGMAGAYQPVGMTPDKSASLLVVSDLDPATTYSFHVQTITNPHANNTNTVASELSEVVTGTTAGSLGPVSSDVDTHGGSGLVSDLNSVLEPGETVAVSPTWRNTDFSKHVVDGTASSFTGPAGATYAVFDATASFGRLLPLETANCHDATGNCYALSVSDPAVRPATHWDAQRLETLSTGETKTWTVHIGGSFSDVPRTHWAYRFVETILHHGITAGCGTTTFCPSNPLTRAEMAVLLLAAKHGPGWAPPASTGGVFTDVPIDHWAGDFIETLAAEGITGGCGVGLYCPDNPTTRAEMAVFLLVAEHGSGWTPPASTGTIFTDVPIDHWAGDFIEALAAEGITGGCAEGLYCPDSPVTRAEMAVFLPATFDLKLY